MTESDDQQYMRYPCAISKFHNPIMTKPSKQISLKDEDPFFFDYFQQKIAFLAQNTVKIYEIIKKEENPKILFHSEFQAHEKMIRWLSWQTPKEENLIATCGDDGFTKIFKETGRMWREIWSHNVQKLQPLKAIWIQDESRLAIIYKNGYLEILSNQQIIFTQQLYNFECVDLDIQKLDSMLLLVCSGRDSSTSEFSLKICSIDEEFKIIYEEQAPYQMEKIQIAPFLGEIKFAGLYQGAILILNFEIEETLKELQGNLGCSQIHPNSNVTKIQWSIFGNQIQVYTQNGLREYQQNIKNEYIAI